MKVKKSKLPPVTAPPKSVRHAFRTGDVIKFGRDEVLICQVDYSAGVVYYSISYQVSNAKRPVWGWVLANFFDDMAEGFGQSKVKRTSSEKAKKPSKKVISDEPVVIKILG